MDQHADVEAMAHDQAGTEVVLIGGETLRVIGPIEAVADSIARGSQSDASGWAILVLEDGSTIRARCTAVAYLRKPPGATLDHLRVA
jgi:hypothetical protein